ncbi:MAG TPA: hypothetical protein VH328_00425 [Burkholderiaceae bacterium]|nr:hypothetical protein [Burkholderiaceae bacterium]
MTRRVEASEVAMQIDSGISHGPAAQALAILLHARYELRFQSLFHTGRALAFPCDDRGEVHWDAMSDRARSSFLRARDAVGIEFATPAVQLSELH